MRRFFLTAEEVLAIHADLFAHFGGSASLRDPGALAPALLRPQLGYCDCLVEDAAALMESLAMNHPFVGGNKRVAFFVTDAFLRMNGGSIDRGGEEAYEHSMGPFEMNTSRFAPRRCSGKCPAYSLAESSIARRTY